jgi:hypothetical protein
MRLLASLREARPHAVQVARRRTASSRSFAGPDMLLVTAQGRCDSSVAMASFLLLARPPCTPAQARDQHRGPTAGIAGEQLKHHSDRRQGWADDAGCWRSTGRHVGFSAAPAASCDLGPWFPGCRRVLPVPEKVDDVIGPAMASPGHGAAAAGGYATQDPAVYGDLTLAETRFLGVSWGFAAGSIAWLGSSRGAAVARLPPGEVVGAENPVTAPDLDLCVRLPAC